MIDHCFTDKPGRVACCSPYDVANGIGTHLPMFLLTDIPEEVKVDKIMRRWNRKDMKRSHLLSKDKIRI